MTDNRTAELELIDWIKREMPAGTVIGDPEWWASRIAYRARSLTAPRAPEGWKLAGHVAVCEDGSVFYEYFAQTAEGISAAMAADGWEGMSVQPVYMLAASPEPVAQRPIVWQYTDENGEQAYTTIKAKALESDLHPMPLYAEPVAPADSELARLRERVKELEEALDKIQAIADDYVSEGELPVMVVVQTICKQTLARRFR